MAEVSAPAHCNEPGACDAGYSGWCTCGCAGCGELSWTVPVFHLGAADPEMEEIERILRTHGLPVQYATLGGDRPRGGDAYRCDGPDDSGPSIMVECARTSGRRGRVVDHHRPGDPGFGRPAADSVRASSLGQIVGLLRLDQCPVCKDRVDWHDTSGSAGAPCLGLADAGQPGGTGPCGDLHHWPLAGWEMEKVRLIAAGDHALGAAYAGKIPGVDPDALMRLRAETRAAFQKRPVGDVLEDIAAAHEALRSAPRLVLGTRGSSTHCGRHARNCGEDCFCDCEDCGPEDISCADLRGRKVPELPEAATRGGVPYIADGLPEPSGRVKVVASGDSDVIRAFLGWAAHEGLVDAYGDPARGFAGAYVPACMPCEYHRGTVYEAGCGDCTRQR